MLLDITPDQLDTLIVMATSYKEYMEDELASDPTADNQETLALIEDTVTALYKAQTND